MQKMIIMGNTPVHNKRRSSGSGDLRSYSSTPPYVNLVLPPSKRRNLQSLDDLSKSAPDDIPLSDENDHSSSNMDVDETASMLRAASLHDAIDRTNLDDTADSDAPDCFQYDESIASVTATPFGSRLHEEEMNLIRAREAQIPILPTAIQNTEPLVPTIFRWNGGGTDIYVSGSFNAWKTRVPMVKRNSGTYAIVDCKPGVHEYKYFIDGTWYHDPTKPTVDNGLGTKNNVVQVKSSDFDVLHALKQDQANSRNRSRVCDASDFSCMSQSPPGEYGKSVPAYPSELRRYCLVERDTEPVVPGIGTLTHPPLLPPHLLQGILNMDTSIQCDPNLLPPPNHVIVNHLYALSIKDGVIVLSVISRFRQKFVSTLFYKPIET